MSQVLKIKNLQHLKELECPKCGTPVDTEELAGKCPTCENVFFWGHEDIGYKKQIATLQWESGEYWDTECGMEDDEEDQAYGYHLTERW